MMGLEIVAERGVVGLHVHRLMKDLGMKRERQFSVDLMNNLRHTVPDCFIIKHADRFTAGVPDMSVSARGFTTWLEDKALDRVEDLHRELGQDQLLTCVKLERSARCCWIVAFVRKPEPTTWIFRPSRVLRQMQINDRLPKPPAGPYTALGINNLFELWEHGALRLEGHNYNGIASLILLTH